MVVMSNNNIRQLITIMDSISKRGQAIRAIRGFIKVLKKKFFLYILSSFSFGGRWKWLIEQFWHLKLWEDEWKIEKRKFLEVTLSTS